jgi:hypothetical protein
MEPSAAEAMDGKEVEEYQEVNHPSSETKAAPKKHFFRRVKK